MLQTVLIVFHLMVVIALVIVVLLQRSEGGALGIGSSTGGFMTGRGQANVLTRATAILATLFFATSLALTIIANLHRAPRSIFDQATPAGQTAPAPGQAPGGDLLDQLKGIDQSRGGTAPSAPAPAAPTAPEVPRQ